MHLEIFVILLVLGIIACSLTAWSLYNSFIAFLRTDQSSLKYIAGAHIFRDILYLIGGISLLGLSSLGLFNIVGREIVFCEDFQDFFCYYIEPFHYGIITKIFSLIILFAYSIGVIFFYLYDRWVKHKITSKDTIRDN